MKITLCGSIMFYEQMQDIAERLVALGHEVKLPPAEISGPDGQMIKVQDYYRLRKETITTEGWIWDQKELAIRRHFDKIDWADVILVTNFDKKGIVGYIGANTLIEMGVAFYSHKKIYLLKSVPETDSKEEILGMKPTVIADDLSLIV
jgi:hypothetical protein